MSKKYTIDYFIKKFTAIPYAKWTTGRFYDPETGARCAMGHCGVGTTLDERSSEARALHELFRASLLRAVTLINDYRSDKFPQTTPRGRILAALRDIKKLC